MVLHDALHQRLTQTALQRGDALHRWRQLAVVTCQDHPRHPPDGYPAGGLEGLGSLVDKQGAELLTLKQTVGRAYQRAGDHPRLAEQLCVDAQLQFRSPLLQSFHLLVVILS